MALLYFLICGWLNRNDCGIRFVDGLQMQSLTVWFENLWCSNNEFTCMLCITIMPWMYHQMPRVSSVFFISIVSYGSITQQQVFTFWQCQLALALLWTSGKYLKYSSRAWSTHPKAMCIALFVSGFTFLTLHHPECSQSPNAHQANWFLRAATIRHALAEPPKEACAMSQTLPFVHGNALLQTALWWMLQFVIGGIYCVVLCNISIYQKNRRQWNVKNIIIQWIRATDT